MPDPRGKRDRPVFILGAGLTGMSASLALRDAGIDHCIVEKEAEVGGLATTISDCGYRFDRTGHLLHLRDRTRHARILSLLDEPPLELERRSLIYSEGAYTAYPYQSNTFGLSPETAYHCLLDFVRTKLIPAQAQPNNFEEYCRAHFGDTISERFMLPYNRRLFGVEPREIMTSWCDRFVPIPALEDVLAGAVGYHSRALGYNATGLYPRHGIGELSRAMGRRLTSLVLRSRPRWIDVHARKIHFDDWSASYQTLISTIPLPTLLDVIGDLPASVAAARRNLRSTPLYYLDVALRRPPAVNVHWIYVPEDRFPFYRVGNYAAFSPCMAPDGAANLYIELADRAEPDLCRLWPRVEAGLTEMRLIESPASVDFCRVRHLDYAYVIYDSSREPALSVIDGYLKTVGILCGGRYGGWNYSSMQDALEFGEQAAQAAHESLA